MRRLDPATLRAACWALVQLRRVRRRLRAGGLEGVTVEPPRSAPRHATRGVRTVLRHGNATCLERSLVLQRWYAAQGIERDVVIGVTSPADFSAHAWLDGDPTEPAAEFRELHRLAP